MFSVYLFIYSRCSLGFIISVFTCSRVLHMTEHFMQRFKSPLKSSIELHGHPVLSPFLCHVLHLWHLAIMSYCHPLCSCLLCLLIATSVLLVHLGATICRLKLTERFLSVNKCLHTPACVFVHCFPIASWLPVILSVCQLHLSLHFGPILLWNDFCPWARTHPFIYSHF